MSFSAQKYLKHEVLIFGTSNTLLNMLIAWLLLKNGQQTSWLFSLKLSEQGVKRVLCP